MTFEEEIELRLWRFRAIQDHEEAKEAAVKMSNEILEIAKRSNNEN